MSSLRRRVYVDGVRIHYLLAGRGHHGVPVVIVSPARERSAAANDLLRAIGEARLAFSVDLPGQGLSGQPRGIRRRAPWLRRWLDTLGFEQCHLVALGAAAGTGIALAQAAPARVASLSLVSPPTPAGTVLNRVVGSARRTPFALRHASEGFARARALLGPGEDFAIEQALPLLAHVPVQTAIVRGVRDGAVDLQPDVIGTHVHAIDLPGRAEPVYRRAPVTVANALDDWWREIEGTEGAASRSGELGKGTG